MTLLFFFSLNMVIELLCARCDEQLSLLTLAPFSPQYYDELKNIFSTSRLISSQQKSDFFPFCCFFSLPHSVWIFRLDPLFTRVTSTTFSFFFLCLIYFHFDRLFEVERSLVVYTRRTRLMFYDGKSWGSRTTMRWKMWNSRWWLVGRLLQRDAD